MSGLSVGPLVAELRLNDSTLAALAKLLLLQLDASESWISLWQDGCEHVVAHVSAVPPSDSMETVREQFRPSNDSQSAATDVAANEMTAAALRQWSFTLASSSTSELTIYSEGTKDVLEAASGLFAAPLVDASGSLIGCVAVRKVGVASELDSARKVFLSDAAVTALKQLALVEENISLRQAKLIARGLDIFYAGGSELKSESAANRFEAMPDTSNERLCLGRRTFIPATSKTSEVEVSASSKKLESMSSPLTKSETSCSEQVTGIEPTRQSEADKPQESAVIACKDGTTDESTETTFSRACNLILEILQVDGIAIFNQGSAVPMVTDETENSTPAGKSRAELLVSRVRQGPDMIDAALELQNRPTVDQLNFLTKVCPQGQLYRAEELGVHNSQEQLMVIEDCVPADAQNIAFVPLVAAQEGCPSAACLVWTQDAAKQLDPGLCLLIIRVFGQSALSESARSRADAADAAKSRFIKSITHELRSPLHGILGGIEFIRAAPLQIFEKHMLDTIESCGNTLLDLIQNVLDMSGIEDGQSVERDMEPSIHESAHTIPKLALDKEEHNMVHVIEEVMMSALLAHITLTRAKSTQEDIDKTARGILLRSNSSRLLQPRLPQVIIHSDWDKDWICSVSLGMIRRIVLALFSNALKFTASGHILISAERVDRLTDERLREGENSCEVAISISDSGKGLGRKFLFDSAGKAFRQEDSLTPGAGLGLHLVQKAVQQLGGTFKLSSTMGEGTTATVYLPTSHYVRAGYLSEESGPRSIREVVQGLPVAFLGWEICNNESDYAGLQFAKQSFQELFEVAFGMKTTPCQNFSEEDEVAVILCDDMTFEKFRGDGTIEDLLCKPRAFLVFCSSIRYAAYMSSEYPAVSFLTPPPGPNQLARVLARHFQNEVFTGTDEALAGTSSRARAADKFVQKTVENEDRFYEKTKNLAPNVQSSHEGLATQTNNASSKASAVTDAKSSDEHQPQPAGLDNTTDSAQAELHVLLVEDNDINMQLLVRFASKHKIDYATASNGQRALDKYSTGVKETQPFNVIIMDISMPVMDGLEATRRIRALEQEQDLPAARIVALTGAVSSTACEDALSAGCNIFLSKPASFKKLKEVLDGFGQYWD